MGATLLSLFMSFDGPSPGPDDKQAAPCSASGPSEVGCAGATSSQTRAVSSDFREAGNHLFVLGPLFLWSPSLKPTRVWRQERVS